jgi:hypothetical protein
MATKTQEYRRAWPILLASILGTGTSVAVISGYSMGALVAPLTEAFGWSRAEVTAAPFCASVGYFVAGNPLDGKALTLRWQRSPSC